MQADDWIVVGVGISTSKFKEKWSFHGDQDVIFSTSQMDLLHTYPGVAFGVDATFGRTALDGVDFFTSCRLLHK